MISAVGKWCHSKKNADKMVPSLALRCFWKLVGFAARHYFAIDKTDLSAEKASPARPPNAFAFAVCFAFGFAHVGGKFKSICVGSTVGTTDLVLANKTSRLLP